MQLKRNNKLIKEKLYIKENKLYTSDKTIIEIPKYYEDKGLVRIEHDIQIYGVCSIQIGNEYGVSVIPTMFSTKPLLISEIDKDGEAYYNFAYAKNTAIVENMTVLRHYLLSYEVFNSYFMLNKTPWYVEYEDLVKMMDLMQKYADSGIGVNHISNEVMVSFVTRSAKDPKVFHRQDINQPYMYVDFNDVFYSTFSTLNKIGGSYFQDALVSAINTKSKQPTKIERLARR